jgi:hypothetical protein
MGNLLSFLIYVTSLVALGGLFSANGVIFTKNERARQIGASLVLPAIILGAIIASIGSIFKIH